jgi:hypothetical protein
MKRMDVKEKVGFKTEWRIYKFRDPDNALANMLRAGAKVEDVARQFPEAFIGSMVEEGNIALYEGLYLLCGLISGIDTSSAKWDSSNAYLGVGDSNAAESASQTGLQGSNKTYKGMDANYPQRAAGESASEQYVEWRATFGADEANYAWNEFTVANGNSDAAKNLNRKVTSKGTKASGETWTLSLKITFS